MLRCALDGRRGSVRLVLAACSAPPEVLEGHCFPRTVQPERVLTRLEAWRESYGVVLDRLTCCAEDPLPDGLIAALEADGCRIEWLRRDDVAAVMAAWQQIRPDPRWDRAGLMAALAEARLEAAPSDRKVGPMPVALSLVFVRGQPPRRPAFVPRGSAFAASPRHTLCASGQYVPCYGDWLEPGT